MSTLEKAKARLRSLPKDYTYSEARQLLLRLGFEESNRGKTSGSRVGFYRECDNDALFLHKPHPGDQMKISATRNLAQHLLERGDL